MKKTIITTSLLALFAGAAMATEYDVELQSMSNVTISNPDGADQVQGSVAGNYSGKSVSMKDVEYKDISVSVDYDDNTRTTQLHGGITRISKGTLTVENSTFQNINMHSQYQVQGGAIYVNGVGAKAVITGSTFDSITSSIGDYTPSSASPDAMGSAIISWQADLSVNDTVFSNNKTVANKASHWAEAGAIYLMMTGKPDSGHTEGEKVSFTNVKFINNEAVNTADNNLSIGGAITVQGRWNGVLDSTRSLTFTDTEFQGNKAGSGGAIYSDTQSMTFNVTAGKELSYVGNRSFLGDEAGGFIYMKVNSPDGGVTYKDVFATFNIAENAKLTIGDGTVGYDSIASSNNHATINKIGVGSLVVNSSMEYFTGTLNVNEGSMIVNSTLGASDIVIASGATLTLGDDTDIILYGCSITLEDGATLELGANSTITVNLEEDFTGTTNLFTLAEGATLSQEGESVTLASLQDNMTVTYNGQTLDKSQWSFDTETGELKAAVPEPSTYAMSFGAIALGFIAYRRRK